MTAGRKVQSIFFFPNGMAAVCDDQGQAITELQGSHQEAIHALRKRGISLEDIEIVGRENIRLNGANVCTDSQPSIPAGKQPAFE